MLQKQRKLFSVELSQDLLSLLNDKPWYLPDTTTLTYQGFRFPAMMSAYGMYPDVESCLKYSAVNLGGASQDCLNLCGAPNSIAIGGGGNDTLGSYWTKTPTATVRGGFLWGGDGADTFNVFIDPVTSKANDVIFDLTAQDMVFVQSTIEKESASGLTQQQFNALVQAGEKLYKKSGARLSFGGTITPVKGVIRGSMYDDLLYPSVDGPVTMFGYGGNDSLEAADVVGGDYFDGGDGDDILNANGGGKEPGKGDYLVGGLGRDTFYYYENDTIADASAEDTIIVSTNGIRLFDNSPARVIFSLSSTRRNEVLQGGNDDDFLRANHNGVTLVGGLGRDQFQIDARNVVIQDLTLDDTVIITTTDRSVIQYALQNWAWAQLTFHLDYFDASKSVSQSGWKYDDVIWDSPFNDVFWGKEGNDFIHCQNGNDTAFGGFGSDSITGGEGNDALYGDDGSGGPDDGNYLSGDQGDDFVFGAGGDDTIYGGTGNDTLIGQDGNDRINGEAGRDLMYGDNGADTLDGGWGMDTLFGENGNDVLIGGFGDDSLNGGAGDDKLVGGLGDDTMTGGAGNDTFVFGPANTTYIATITDFTSGSDKIDLSGFMLAGFSASAIRNAVQYDATSRLITADINRDGFLDVNVRLLAGTRFNKATDLIVTNPLM